VPRILAESGLDGRLRPRDLVADAMSPLRARLAAWGFSDAQAQRVVDLAEWLAAQHLLEEALPPVSLDRVRDAIQ
jgi:hypothetical protein